MTGNTTPQQQAVELASSFLNERFGITMWNRDLDHHSKELVQILADAGLLCSSPVVQPEQDGDGSLRSGPLATGEALSDTLLEALELLASGLTPQQAARKVHVTNQAINMRVRRAANRLGTTTAIHTVLEAYRRGLIEVPDA